MSKIDALLDELNKIPYFLNKEEKEACRQVIRKHFEIVHNEAVEATTMAENRKNMGKGYCKPQFKD